MIVADAWAAFAAALMAHTATAVLIVLAALAMALSCWLWCRLAGRVAALEERLEDAPIGARVNPKPPGLTRPKHPPAGPPR